MDQNVQTGDAVTFATVNTGQGANELYAMDQDVRKGDSVQFVGLNTTGNTSLGGTLFANGATTLNGATSITGATTIDDNLIVTGTTNLGDVGNITITNGSSGDMLTTDGSGSLSWTSPTAAVANQITAAYLPMRDQAGTSVFVNSALSQSANGGGAANVVTVNAQLDVNYETDITASLDVTGATSLSSTLQVAGSTTLGDADTDSVAINGAADANTALTVWGDGDSNDYTAKFYSGTDLAAFIMKK